MYSGQFDDEAQIFIATLTETVQTSELLQSLGECFTAAFKQEVRALFEISSMQVAFGLDEVEQIVQVLEASEPRHGKLAFVVGDQQFLRSVVESVYSLRNEWTTIWQVFTTKEDALHWLSS